MDNADRLMMEATVQLQILLPELKELFVRLNTPLPTSRVSERL